MPEDDQDLDPQEERAFDWRDSLDGGGAAGQFWRSALDLHNRQPLLCEPEDTKGYPARLPGGGLIRDPYPDRYSKTGYLMAPTSNYNLTKVAQAGREAKAGLMAITRYSPDFAGAWGAYLGYIGLELNRNVGQGGVYDEQRVRNPDGGFTQQREFRKLANLNVGIFAQQFGLRRSDTLEIAGRFAKFFSSNYKPDEQYGLDPRNAYFINSGFDISESGVLNRSPTAP